MKKDRFTVEQIAEALHQAQQGMAMPDICRALGITKKTIFLWKSKYTGLMPRELTRVMQLEEENARLKKLVADLSLDNVMLQPAPSKRGKAS